MKKTKLVLLSGLIAALLSGCGAKDNTELPKPLVPFTPTTDVKVLWKRSTHGGTDKQYLSLGPAVANNHVATVDYKGWVSLFDEKTGNLLWQTDLNAPMSATPSIADGKVFAVTMDGRLFALDESNGKTLWTATVTSTVLSAPTVANNEVFVHVHNGDVIAYDENTGKQLWIVTGTTPELTLEGDSSPVINGNAVIVGFDNGQIQAFNLQTGQVVWQSTLANPQGSSPVARMVDIMGTPVISNGNLYAVSYQGNVASMDANSGNQNWVQSMSSYAGLTIGQNKLALTDSQSHVWALDQNSGNKLWVQNDLEARFVTAPAILGNYVIVGDYAGFVHWLSINDGQFAARIQINNSGIRSQPAVDGNTVFVTTNDGHVAALRAANN